MVVSPEPAGVWGTRAEWASGPGPAPETQRHTVSSFSGCRRKKQSCFEAKVVCTSRTVTSPPGAGNPAKNTPRQRVSLKGWRQRHSFPGARSLARPGGQASTAPARRCMWSVSCLWSAAHGPEGSGATLCRGGSHREAVGQGWMQRGTTRQQGQQETLKSKIEGQPPPETSLLKSSNSSASFRSDCRDYTPES